jgi:glucokinase
MILVGDIGGTKTVLALYAAGSSEREPLVEKRYPSSDYQSLRDIVVQFLEEEDAEPREAIFGVAGPVVNDRARITNLPWVIDGPAMKAEFGWEYVTLLNDLAAVAHAIPVLHPDELTTISPGEPERYGPLAVLAPGTGLGEGFLVWKGDRYRSLSSEGGHKSFGPNSRLELELLQYLHQRFGHVSVERVCSGMGIPNLYAFFRDTGRYEEPPWLRDQLASVADKTPIIVSVAQAGRAEICQATLDLFVDILANEAGNLALQLLTTGGIFLGGGIPPRIVEELKSPRFTEAFINKGRFRDLLTTIPVYIILQSNAALLGAAHYGLSAYAETH